MLLYNQLSLYLVRHRYYFAWVLGDAACNAGGFGFNGEDSLYQDGLRQFREGGYFWWSTETFGLESVELLKGPASILYGEAPPGGVINAISKRPTEEPRGEFEVQAGNEGHRQVGVDVSGPVTGRDDMRYRMVGLYRDGLL